MAHFWRYLWNLMMRKGVGSVLTSSMGISSGWVGKYVVATLTSLVDYMVMEVCLIFRRLCSSAPHWNLITAEIQYSVWSDNYFIRSVWYVLDLLIQAIKVVNCVFVCISGSLSILQFPFPLGVGIYQHGQMLPLHMQELQKLCEYTPPPPVQNLK